MSHTDFIAPFPMEETFDKPSNWLPELRINPKEFAERLLKRWPLTGKPELITTDSDTPNYYFELRTTPEGYCWHLHLLHDCIVQIDRPSDEILASLCHIYRQCVPREQRVYVLGSYEISPNTTEEEILKIITTPLPDKD